MSTWSGTSLPRATSERTLSCSSRESSLMKLMECYSSMLKSDERVTKLTEKNQMTQIISLSRAETILNNTVRMFKSS